MNFFALQTALNDILFLSPYSSVALFPHSNEKVQQTVKRKEL